MAVGVGVALGVAVRVLVGVDVSVWVELGVAVIELVAEGPGDCVGLLEKVRV